MKNFAIAAWILEHSAEASSLMPHVERRPIIEVVLSEIAATECTDLEGPQSVDEWFRSTVDRNNLEVIQKTATALGDKLGNENVECRLGVINVYHRLMLILSRPFDIFSILDLQQAFDPYIINFAVSCTEDKGHVCGFLQAMDKVSNGLSQVWQEAIVSSAFPGLSDLASSDDRRCIFLSWPLLDVAWEKYLSIKRLSNNEIEKVVRSAIPQLDRICDQNRYMWSLYPHIGILCSASIDEVCSGQFSGATDWVLEGFPEALDVVVPNIYVCQELALQIMNFVWENVGQMRPLSISATAFPNVERFCQVDPDSGYYQRDYLRIAMLCSFPIRDICSKMIDDESLLYGPNPLPGLPALMRTIIRSLGDDGVVEECRTLLYTILPQLPRRYVGGRLDVDRRRAFSDSLPLLTSLTAPKYYPTSVYFNGEEGIDAGGLRRDWFGRIAAIVSEPISDDKAGNLFKFTETSGEKLLQLNLDPDQMASEGRGISGAAGLQLTPFGRSVYYAFGRLMAIAFIQREQLGMALPSFFFAKLLNGVITLDDLSPEEEARKTSLEKFAADFEKRDPGDVLESGGIFPDQISSQTITKQNVHAVMNQLADSLIPNVIMDHIRSGFDHAVRIDLVRARFLPRHLKLLIAGESELDVDELETIAKRDDDMPPSDVAFDLLFEWLRLQKTSTHRQFMRFVTGSPSLSARRLTIRGPAVDQGMLPKPHTCSGQLDLPNYTTIEELNEKMLLAIASEEMGMA